MGEIIDFPIMGKDSIEKTIDYFVSIYKEAGNVINFSVRVYNHN